MRSVLKFITFIGVALLAFTHLGTWIPLSDSLSLGRPLVLASGFVIVIVLLFFGLKRWAAGVLVAVIASGVVTWGDFTGGAARGTGPLTLYQKNMLWNGATPESILADILSTDADFVTLQETSSINQLVLDGLEDRFPHRLACASQGNGGIALLSRYPLTPSGAGCSLGSGIVIAQAEVPEIGQIWVGSVHLNWPYPFTQASQVPKILHGLESLDGPIVIAGDFNMIPWGSSVRRIAETAGAVRVGGYLSSFPGFGAHLPFAIDHTLIPRGWQGAVDIRPLAGSDHYGLLLSFGP